VRQKKRPLGFRFLDPTLSKRSHPLPGFELQLEVATRCRISLPAAPTGNVVCPAGPSLLEYRTNLLSPSVTHQPVFKGTQITAAIINIVALYAPSQQAFLEEKFSTGYLLRMVRMSHRDISKQFPLLDTVNGAFQNQACRVRGRTSVSVCRNRKCAV